MANTAKNINRNFEDSLLNSLSKNKYFSYSDEGEMHCEGVNISSIAEKTGTPFFVYSKKYFTDRFNLLSNALHGTNFKIFYAVKSNYNLSIIRHLSSLGAGADVNSAGELYRAVRAGVSPASILLGGVGKSAEEITFALEQGILLFKVESYGELIQIDRIAGTLNKTARVALRVNPNVNAKTHPYISTGLAENKFGIPLEEAEIIYQDKSLPNIKFAGVDMHLGSQIATTEPYAEAIEKTLAMCARLREKGITLHHFDIGGGFGVQYDNESDFPFEEFTKTVIAPLKASGMTIFLEPGRFLSANSSALISKVMYLKKNGNKNFIVTDAGMSELIRPSLYDAYHQIVTVNTKNREKKIYDVVGPLCESGDFIGKELEIEAPEQDELIAVLSAGAYGMAMASNYNARLRPAEVFVDGSDWKIIRKRETLEQLVQNEEDCL